MELLLHVHKAEKLKAADRGGTSDPYVVVTIGKQSFTTGVVMKTLDPAWDQKVYFAFGKAEVAAKQQVEVKCKLFDWDRFKDDPLGVVKFTVELRPDFSFDEKWIDVEGASGRVCFSARVSPLANRAPSDHGNVDLTRPQDPVVVNPNAMMAAMGAPKLVSAMPRPGFAQPDTSICVDLAKSSHFLIMENINEIDVFDQDFIQIFTVKVTQHQKPMQMTMTRTASLSFCDMEGRELAVAETKTGFGFSADIGRSGHPNAQYSVKKSPMASLKQGATLKVVKNTHKTVKFTSEGDLQHFSVNVQSKKRPLWNAQKIVSSVQKNMANNINEGNMQAMRNQQIDPNFSSFQARPRYAVHVAFGEDPILALLTFATHQVLRGNWCSAIEAMMGGPTQNVALGQMMQMQAQAYGQGFPQGFPQAQPQGFPQGFPQAQPQAQPQAPQ